MKEILTTDAGAGQVGNFNLGTSSGDIVFKAGQVPEAEDGEVLTDAPIEEQTDQCLSNIEAVLLSKGLSRCHPQNERIHSRHPTLGAVQQGLRQYFVNSRARTTVGVTDLWGGVDIEIETIATTKL